MRSTVDSQSRYRGEASSRASVFNKSNLQLTGAYNQLHTISKNTKNKIYSDAETLVNAPEISARIWREMRKNDFTTDGPLTAAMLKKLYDIFADQFRDLLYIQNFDVLMDILDTDKNGFISEDEQILLFSLFKERMESVANDLLILQDYDRYKILMKNVRKLEAQINTYQNRLRKRIYSNELRQYHKIGEDKFDQFCAKYSQMFQEFNDSGLMRMDNLNEMHEEQIARLHEKLEKPESLLKIKPVKKLKELQTQEKLVSIDERVEEAINFRKELTKLEKSEEQRVQQLRWQYQEKEIRRLEAEQRKEIEQLKRKLENEENKLIISMQKEFEVLKKQVRLHENDIKRVQGLATKAAWKRGETEGELKRYKARARKQNYIIEEHRQIRPDADPFAEADGRSKTARSHSNRSNNWNLTSTNFTARARDPKREIEKIIKAGTMTKFHIRHQYGMDRPVNEKLSAYHTADDHGKIEKYLVREEDRKRVELPGLSERYNDNLQYIGKPDTNDDSDMHVKTARRKFIQTKIEGMDRKH